LPAVDRLYRRGDAFALHLSAVGDDTGDWTLYNAEQARWWLSECPEQLVEVREAV
jgi:hypothetical protein